MKFRCSSVGKLMTEAKSIAPELLTDGLKAIQRKPVAKRTEGELQALEDAKNRTLSEGAKSYIRQLAKEEIYSYEPDFSNKYTEKGIIVEDESIRMLNRVRGLSLSKNTERRFGKYTTGECDLADFLRNRGHDLKNAWSLDTFPAFPEDAHDALYEWQMRAYMPLWDFDEWEVNHTLVSTPDDLIPRWEKLELHIVDHIPEHQRITTWAIKRDMKLESYMDLKLEIAHDYMLKCIRDFEERTQKQKGST